MNKESEVNLNDYRKVCKEVAAFHYCLTPIEELEDIINKIFEIGKENNFQPKETLIGSCFGYYPLDFLPKSLIPPYSLKILKYLFSPPVNFSIPPRSFRGLFVK